MINCTVTGNAAVNGGNGGGLDSFSYGGGSTTLTNDVFYGDTGGEIYNEGNTTADAAATYCDVQGGYGGTGNVNADPLFFSATDLHLRPGSPCIGSGAASGTLDTDIEGSFRPNPPSIGAYEGRPAAATTLTVPSAAGMVGQTVTLSARLKAGFTNLAGRTVHFHPVRLNRRHRRRLGRDQFQRLCQSLLRHPRKRRPRLPFRGGRVRRRQHRRRLLRHGHADRDSGPDHAGRLRRGRSTGSDGDAGRHAQAHGGRRGPGRRNGHVLRGRQRRRHGNDRCGRRCQNWRTWSRLGTRSAAATRS